MKVNLPTQITLSRLVLTIVFFVLLGQYSQRSPQPWILYVGFGVFVVAAATDYLDGYLARKRNEVTALGRILDPFVDKVLVCGAFIFLAGPSFCNEDGINITFLRPWMLVVILGRELLVTGLRGFSESRGIAFGAGYVGKAKMWIQSITVGVILLAVASRGLEPRPGIETGVAVVVWVMVVVTAASLVTYLMKSKAVLTDNTG